jgi:AraC-like DNA-binding protein
MVHTKFVFDNGALPAYTVWVDWIEEKIPRDVLEGMCHRENCLIAVLQTERFFVQDYRVNCYVLAAPTVGDTSVHIHGREVSIPVGTFYLINPMEEFRPPDTGVAEGLYLILVNDAFFAETYLALYGEGPGSVSNGPFPSSPEIPRTIELFLKESDERRMGFLTTQESLASLLLVTLLRQTSDDQAPLLDRSCSRYRGHIERAKAHLRGSLAEPFSLDNTACAAGLSSYHFARIFRQYTGLTPYAYLTQQRLARAKTLLQTTGLTIKEICFACGFNNTSHFATTFRERVGISPSEHRRCHTE